MCWPQSNIGHCLSALCGFSAAADWCRGFWWLSLLGRGLLQPRTFFTVPEKYVTEENVLGCSFLTWEETRDNMFWITQLCRRKWSGYFPPFADSFAFCPLISRRMGSVQCKPGLEDLGFSESGSTLSAKFVIIIWEFLWVMVMHRHCPS